MHGHSCATNADLHHLPRVIVARMASYRAAVKIARTFLIFLASPEGTTVVMPPDVITGLSDQFEKPPSSCKRDGLAVISGYCAEEHSACAVRFANARCVVMSGASCRPVRNDVSSCQQDPTPPKSESPFFDLTCFLKQRFCSFVCNIFRLVTLYQPRRSFSCAPRPSTIPYSRDPFADPDQIGKQFESSHGSGHIQSSKNETDYPVKSFPSIAAIGDLAATAARKLRQLAHQ